MSNLVPGNQKHLTLDNRVYIEKSLDINVSFKDIAKYLCKDPSTISKEIRKHRFLKERNPFSPNTLTSVFIVHPVTGRISATWLLLV